MADWQIERLERGHVRDSFTCGKPPLDEFIHRLVSQYEKRNLGRTYVAVRPGDKQVLGYYTLASGAIPFQNLPEPSARKLPRHPIPVVLLARLVHGAKILLRLTHLLVYSAATDNALRSLRMLDLIAKADTSLRIIVQNLGRTLVTS